MGQAHSNWQTLFERERRAFERRHLAFVRASEVSTLHGDSAASLAAKQAAIAADQEWQTAVQQLYACKHDALHSSAAPQTARENLRL